MPVTITPLQESDIAEAADVIATIFGEKWRAFATAEFARKFKGEQHATHIFVARQGRQIIGVAGGLETYFAEYTWGLCWVGVLDAHRRQGIARQLIETVEAFIKTQLNGKAGTVVLSTDGPAYYEKMGYTAQQTPMHDGSRLMVKVL